MLTREQVRNLDRIAVERFGIPGIVLMENAGRGATDYLIEHISPAEEDGILVLCGRGNNGGDGFVIARHLLIRGYTARVGLLGERAAFRGEGDAGVNFGICERMDVPILELADAERVREAIDGAAVVVDAILGTGLTGDVRGLARGAIDALNASGLPVFAVDAPSGLDCNTGEVLGAAVRARATATFAARKVGLETEAARPFTGPVRVVDIGTPVVWE